MARLKFLGFDLQGNGVPMIGNTNYTYVAVDPGTEFVDLASDSIFYNPQLGTYPVRSGDGRVNGAGLAGNGISNLPLNSPVFGQAASRCVTMRRDAINNVSEVFCTFDLFFTSPGNQFFSPTLPSSWMVSNHRNQLFKFGDLSLRLKAMTYAGPINGYYNITVAAYNGATHLGDVTALGIFLIAGFWIHVRVNAKLASGTSGAFNILFGGVSASYTNLNTVATTPIDDVDRVWFSAGGMQDPGSNSSYSARSIDNILIDDAAWPTGRPVVALVSSGFSDTSITNWTSSSAGTIADAVLSVDSIRARGTGNGARAILDIPAPTMTTWNSNLLGYQIVPGLLSSLDNVNIKRLKSGVRFSGVDRFGTVTANITPPFSPDRLQNCGTDTIFYNGGTTDFLKANVSSTDVVLEVTS